MRKIILLGGLGAFLFQASPSIPQTKATKPLDVRPPSSTSKPSSASITSEKCNEQGGNIIKKKRGDGADYEVCIFEDDRQCEIYALIAGDCKKGGVPITGFSKQEQIYCAILGGQNSEVQDICTFKGGTHCELRELFNGTCVKGEKRQEIMSGPFH
jgi:putative hemolysin